MYSHEAARRVKLEGGTNDLIERISADERIPLTKAEILSELDPVKFIGRSPSQVVEFISDVVEPILDKYHHEEVKAELSV